MFVVILNYIKPVEEIDRWLEEHRAFLAENYAAGRFIASGRLEPRTGGVILARGGSKAELETILEADPFKREGLAAYTVLEFLPAMHDPRFAPFVEGGA
ncbi:YciI family protein [Fundidesulfovibrio agrisoli]|uniref:YciI family protein n=1 Tax=Fundidesulfovibrio agrisoli TaxID=2922717 RepID=UPI001FAE4BDE|nr:YciI family protein [Fundidesulfovibrio agrisoli]